FSSCAGWGATAAPGRAHEGAVLWWATVLDLKFVVQHGERVRGRLEARGSSLAQIQAGPGLAGVDPWALDVERRAAIHEVEELRHRQRVVGEEIARRGRAREDASELKAEMKGVADRIKAGDERLGGIGEKLRQRRLAVPK